MYDTHMPLLAKHAGTPAGFADIVTFAIAAQNQHFYRVRSILQELRKTQTSPYLSKRQHSGITFVRHHASLFMPCTETESIGEALRRVLELPSVGFIKGGFILQMCGYNIGCLDRHMCSVTGLSPSVFNHIPASTEGLTCRIANYIATCHAFGGSEHLWNSWCALIAQKYPSHFADADAVSAYHVLCIMGVVL